MTRGTKVDIVQFKHTIALKIFCKHTYIYMDILNFLKEIYYIVFQHTIIALKIFCKNTHIYMDVLNFFFKNILYIFFPSIFFRLNIPILYLCRRRKRLGYLFQIHYERWEKLFTMHMKRTHFQYRVFSIYWREDEDEQEMGGHDGDSKEERQARNKELTREWQETVTWQTR